MVFSPWLLITRVRQRAKITSQDWAYSAMSIDGPTGFDRVVPVRTGWVPLQAQGRHFLVRHSDPLLVLPPQQSGLHRIPRLRLGPPDASQERTQGAQRLPRP